MKIFSKTDLKGGGVKISVQQRRSKKEKYLEMTNFF